MFPKGQVSNLFPVYDLPVGQLAVLSQSQDLALGAGVVEGRHQGPRGVQDLLPAHVGQVADIPDDARPIFAS